MLNSFIDAIKSHPEHLIYGVLFLMSFIMLWKVLERWWFYHRIALSDYAQIEYLDIALNKGLTPIFTIGANAPYVGLLGTVIGILMTFYAIGTHGGVIDVSEIMIGLALSLKATALGIGVAIPAMIFYNLLSQRAATLRLKWQANQETAA